MSEHRERYVPCGPSAHVDSFAAEVPYVVALIELDVGDRMASNLIDCAAHQIAGGLAVEVVFDNVTREVTLPKFHPARGA